MSTTDNTPHFLEKHYLHPVKKAGFLDLFLYSSGALHTN